MPNFKPKLEPKPKPEPKPHPEKTTIQLRLARASTLVEFLQGELTDGRRKKDRSSHKRSYAEFARKAGFSARSYPREIALGRKTISAKALPRFLFALGLKGDAAKLFRELAVLDNPALSGVFCDRAVRFNDLAKHHRKHSGKPSREPSEVHPGVYSRLESLRQKLLKRGSPAILKEETNVFENRKWPYVFTALGSETVGTTIAEMKRKLILNDEDIQEIITDLLKREMIRREGDRIFPVHEKLVYLENSKNGMFKSFYLDTIREAERRAQTRFNSEDELFFNSVFAIPASKAPQLKRELKELLLRFVQEVEEPDGGAALTLVCAMTQT